MVAPGVCRDVAGTDIWSPWEYTTRAADLVRQLLEAPDARELGRFQRRLLTLDVLIIDELASCPSTASAASCSSI